MRMNRAGSLSRIAVVVGLGLGLMGPSALGQASAKPKATAQSGAKSPAASPANKPTAAGGVKPAANKPATAPAKDEPSVKDKEELAAISHKLTGDATTALEAGKLDVARAAIDDASKRLSAYVEKSGVKEWNRSVASIYQLIDHKTVTLAMKLKAAGKPDASLATKPKIAAASLKEIADTRKNLMQVKGMIMKGDVETAKKTVEDATQLLDKVVADSGAPLWHEALAPTFQALDLSRSALDEEMKVRKDEAVVAADAASDRDSKALKVGDKIPPIAAITVDGKPLNSKMLAGKWVLIDFWATWCGPCRGEIPNLREVYDTYGKDSRFVLVSLSIDDKVVDPREFTQQNNMKWTQGFLGKGWAAPLLGQFGIHGIPAIYLVDPNGKIVAKDLRGDRIKKTVASFLDEKPGV